MILRMTAQAFVVSLACAALALAQAQRVDGKPGDAKDGMETSKAAPAEPARAIGHLEVPRDPYLSVPREGRATTPGAREVRNGYVSIQVNVDEAGDNIVGDAANEPSIAVDLNVTSRMVIGWRQFDSIMSDFRQAGWGYTTDAGQSWTFPGVIEPGVFRSDPVLDFDVEGNFYYNSLTADAGPSNFRCHVFKSIDGGATWDLGVYAHGGDKQWMTIDRTDGIGQGNIYAAWNLSFSSCSGDFTRSYDGGQTFLPCTYAPGSPQWGTLAVGPDGELYLCGSGFVVAKSSTMQDEDLPPEWDFSTTVSLDGSMSYSAGPNPGGLLGQAWIAVDHSGGDTHGNVYLLCSVSRYSTSDPLDVMFARSTDGGVTWSAPIRINDDPEDNGAWQWFSTMSVAPNGRIDATWADTRNDPGGYDSEIYYSYSTDGGETWTPNEVLTPAFDPHVGWPQQNKIGDYYDMVSDDRGADFAFSTTFNGEQDVYYMRLGDPACPDAGIVRLDRDAYPCESTANVMVLDCNLNADSQVAETTTVTIDSGSEPAGETMELTETGPDTSQFEGSIALSETDDSGVLLVAEGDTVTVTYIDEDDGEGGTSVVVTDTAVVDCTAPIISNVQTIDIEPRSATVTFDTDEPTEGTVHYGTSCDSLTEKTTSSGYTTTPEVDLTGLEDNTTYFYAVEAEDEAGNIATDDNGGACYTFTTPEVPDFFTEQFSSGNDLDYLTLTFEPNGSVDFYDGCTETIESLPTDPAGGTMLSISEDSYQQVTLSDGQTVSLYGVSYSSFYVCDNGYITFTGSDTDYTESLADHFDMPRISIVFDDFSVDDAGGTVSWKQLSDRAAVTYENVPEYGTSNSNTFQVELFFDGTITISYLEVAVIDGLAGLSEGEGLSPDFYPTDLSEMGACGPKPPTAMPVAVTGPVGVDSIAITLEATDDGLPDPPAALTYIVTSPPAHGDLYEAGFGQITSVPHELADNGNELSYQPEPTYSGGDNFQYVANDGGVPPEGGDSDPATVSITIGGPDWDPQAFNVNASTPASTPVDVVLNATDPNGDPLTYFIESLPASGTLNDPGAGAITEVPYEVAGGGHIVQYAPPVGEETLTAQFTYYAMDATATSNVATATVTVGGPAWEPVAYPVTAATPISTPVDVTLNAIDPNGDPLTYFIESLPLEGTLDDPGAGAITEVPYELVDGGAVVRYTPPIYQNLVAEFEYSARDATAGSNVALVTVTVGGPMTFFEDDFETDKGWTIENIEITSGAWERLVPIAGSPGAPSSDYDGSGRCYLTERAIGADVDGGPTRLISPTVNVAGVIDPKLRYARWFTNDDADEDRLDVEISNDNGASWVLIESVPDTVGWVEPTIEMIDYIAPTAQMKVRFSATDNPNNSVTEAAIDAIEIWGLPEVELPGDYDENGLVDLADFVYFPECMTGPDAGPATTECEVFYFDEDDDVDLGDFAGFQAMMAEF